VLAFSGFVKILPILPRRSPKVIVKVIAKVIAKAG
jgi:hypothetical protein